jgi:hypothetical protein
MTDIKFDVAARAAFVSTDPSCTGASVDLPLIPHHAHNKPRCAAVGLAIP